MSSHRQTLKAFVQPVLICALPIDFDGVLQQIYSKTDTDIERDPTESVTARTIEHLIVVNQQAHPLGCLPIAKVLQARTILKSVNTAQLLEPLHCLPAHTSLQAFWAILQTSSPQERVHWGITEGSGKEILGLIDLPQILPALTQAQSQSFPNLSSKRSPISSQREHPLQVEKLISERHVKDILLSEISHELKNPLTAILGLFNILQQTQLEQITERQQRYLTLIDEKTSQLMTVVQKVMLLSQLQNKEYALQLEVVEVRPLCEQAISHSQLAPTTTIDFPKIKLHIHEQIPPLIADQSCLNKILCALIKQGMLSNQPITLQVEPWGGWISFTVSPNQAVEQAEDTPQQPNRFPHQTHENNLLDLQLAHQLAHLHQGVICISRLSEGNGQFTLLIPPNLATPPVLPAHIAQMSRQLALIIATDLEIIAVLQTSLEQQGYRVAIAQSDSEALALPHQLQPGVIFIHQAFALSSGANTFKLIEASCETTPIQIGSPSPSQTDQLCLELPLTHEAITACLDHLPVDTSAPRGKQNVAPVPKKEPDLTSTDRPPPRPQLTVLHLETSAKQPLSSESTLHTPIFNISGCQVISIENLAEAPLLLEIWHPQVILYTGSDLTPLQDLDQQSPLTQLPLVVTDPKVAAQAKQLSHLTVYEYSISSVPQSQEAHSKALIQTLQIAADRTQAPDPMP